MSLILSLLSLLTLGSTFQFFNATTETFLYAPQDCLKAVNSDIRCSNVLSWAQGDGTYDLSSEQLAALCTNNCFEALAGHRSGVASSCASVSYYDSPTDSLFAPTILDDQLLYAFNSTCMKSPSTGKFCSTWFQGVGNGTIEAKNVECDGCYLQNIQFELSSPLGNANDFVSSYYASLTSSCASTQLPPSTPSGVIVSSPTPTPTTECGGTMYPSKSGDTANSIAIARGTSSEIILEANGLQDANAPIAASRQLCIEKACKTYVIEANSTCTDITSAANVTYAQLLAWNLNINQRCTNLNSFVGWVVCISNPEGDYVLPSASASPTAITTPAPVPTSLGPNTTTNCGRYYEIDTGDTCETVALKFNIALSDFYFLNPGIDGNCTNLWLDAYFCVQPVGDISTYPGYGGATATTPIAPGQATELPFVDLRDGFKNTQPVITIANGSRVDCKKYYWARNITNNGLSDCWALAVVYDVAFEDFILWNPSLDSQSNVAEANKTYNYPCTISASSSYCVALSRATAVPVINTPPTPRAAGETKNCTAWTYVEDSTTCASIIGGYRMSFEDFYAYNPAINSDCSGLNLGTWYCISIDPSGDPPFAESDTITAIPSTRSTSALPTSASPTHATGIVTPSPVQTGMVSNCNKFYQVVSGDSCWAIANDNSIALGQLYAWNPALNGDCTGLQPPYYVCIGIEAASSSSVAGVTSSSVITARSSSTSSGAIVTPTPFPANMQAGCKQFYKIVNGDHCYKVIEQFGITMEDFVKWNPDAGDASNCAVWLDYYYCVAH